MKAFENRGLVEETTKICPPPPALHASSFLDENASVSTGASSRIAWIDICRVYAIFAIIVGHTNIRTCFPSPPAALSWMVVLLEVGSVSPFFFLSGYFTKPCSHSWFNWQRVKMLLFPFIIWSCVGYVLFPLFEQIGGELDFSYLWKNRPWEMLGTFWSVSTPGHWDLWFMKVLIFWTIFAVILARLSSISLLCLVLLAFSLSFAFEYPVVKHIPFFLETSSLEGLGFFALGIWCRRFVALDSIARQLQHRLFSLISLKIFLSIALVFSIPWGMNALPGLSYRAFQILVLFCIGIAVMKYMPRLGVRMARFGEAVFFVYIMQEFLIHFLRSLFKAYPVISPNAYALVPFAVMAASLAFFFLIKKMFPSLMPYLCMAKNPCARQ